MPKLKVRRGAVLSTITTVIFLVVFVVTLVLLTVYIAIMQLKGTSGGTASITSEIRSEYAEERVLLYLTDEHGNKLTDLIGQALLYPAGSKIILSGDLTSTPVSSLAINNQDYTCAPGNLITAVDYDPNFDTSSIDINRYLRCYVIPNKLGKMYGPGQYCLNARYDRLGIDHTNTTFGNDTLADTPECGGGQIIALDLAPPPGYDKPITLKLEKG